MPRLDALGVPDWLPDHGRLLFFFDMDGFDAPSAQAVFHRLHDAAATLVAAPPDLLKTHRYGARAIGFGTAHAVLLNFASSIGAPSTGRRDLAPPWGGEFRAF